MTLTEFLLARIAEDERDTVLASSRRPFDGVSRWIDECSAKRRIVEYHQEASKGSGEVAHNSRLEGIIVATSWALHFLALPYADHPDYRQEWKP